MFSRKGFTLIELVMVIVILGILAAVAIPKFFDLQNEAEEAAEKGVVGGVRAGIATYYADDCINNPPCNYPASLDSATNGACTAANPCFDTVLSQGGVTSDWTRNSSTSYTGPNGTTYTYTPATGEFN